MQRYFFVLTKLLCTWKDAKADDAKPSAGVDTWKHKNIWERPSHLVVPTWHHCFSSFSSWIRGGVNSPSFILTSQGVPAPKAFTPRAMPYSKAGKKSCKLDQSRAVSTGFGMIDDSKSKFLRVENVGTLKHMNLTSCASLIMSTGMINQQLLLEVIFTASTSLTNPFPKYCSFSKVAASEDKVAQAEALAQEAEKNPLPQEAGLCSMEVGSESHFFHHWGRGIVAVGGVSVVFGGKLTGVSG